MVGTPPNPVTPPANEHENPNLMEALLARIQVLEAQQATAAVTPKPPNLSKAVRRPEAFVGTQKDRNNRSVEIWLHYMEFYLKATRVEAESDKINVAASHLDGTARREYDTRVTDAGSFESYDAFRQWLTQHYSPADPVNTARDAFLNCRQGETESLDTYFERFRMTRNLLDEAPSQSWIVYHFVNQLLPRYKALIRGDKEFAEYKDISLDDVLAKLKRMNPLLVTSQYVQPKLQHDRPTQSTSQGKRRKFNNSSTTSASNYITTPLSDGEKRFLENNIKKGGGILLRESVQNNTEWIQRARTQGLCIKCAGKGHYAKDCPTTRQSSSSRSFNAIMDDNQLEHLNDLSQE